MRLVRHFRRILWPGVAIYKMAGYRLNVQESIPGSRVCSLYTKTGASSELIQILISRELGVKPSESETDHSSCDIKNKWRANEGKRREAIRGNTMKIERKKERRKMWYTKRTRRYGPNTNIMINVTMWEGKKK
jgi:hypothetical protein